VNFRQLSDPKEEGFTLELWQDYPYTEVGVLAVCKTCMQTHPPLHRHTWSHTRVLTCAHTCSQL